VDGPQGIRRGATEIADVLAGQLGIAPDQTVEIDALAANGGLVMVEWHGGFTFNGKWITTAVMAVFEVDVNGRVNQWREKYDLKSVTDQMAAADSTVPG
jgi:limonene-1,2-epoxide hydrolase